MEGGGAGDGGFCANATGARRPIPSASPTRMRMRGFTHLFLGLAPPVYCASQFKSRLPKPVKPVSLQSANVRFVQSRNVRFFMGGRGPVETG